MCIDIYIYIYSSFFPIVKSNTTCFLANYAKDFLSKPHLRRFSINFNFNFNLNHSAATHTDCRSFLPCFMGLSCVNVCTKLPKLTTLTSLNLLLCLVKDVLILLLSYLPQLWKFLSFRHRNHDDYQPEDRPSPSLVSVPFHLIDESIKKQLPITEYGDLLKRRGACSAEDLVCVVCLNNMEASDGVRDLCNCSHVFHKECLDVWIGQGQVTCPLCRSKLSPSQREEPGLGGDPWRLERLNYLFGEDYDMVTF